MKKTFNREQEWPFKPVTESVTRANKKKIHYNTKLFAKWLWKVIKEGYGKDLEKGETYTMLGMSMSENNIRFLHDHINAWDWLCYSPKTDSSLADDEINFDFFVINS